MMRSGNPVLRGDVFGRSCGYGEKCMTIAGTVNRTFILLALLLGAAAWVWQAPPANSAVFFGAAIGGMILAIVTAFKRSWAPYTAPVYALCEGALLGWISAALEARYPGIAVQAVSLTFAVLFGLLVIYRLKLIRVTQNFALGLGAAMFGIFLIYVADLALGFAGRRIPMIHEGGTAGILFSLFVVTVAALNLVMDFDYIERGADSGAPKYMEWYGAFGLIVTLVWLYLEILRLLAKSRR